jgi:anti-sigma regulatory factor (Ser/Thr protein kinase)
LKVNLAPDPKSASVARAFVRRELTDVCPPDLVDVAELLVSELVTNAVLHARTPLRVDLDSGPRGVRVAVTDGSSTLPRVRDHTPGASTGRGLQMVASLADAWGTDLDGEGKTVWFELSPAGLAAAHSMADGPDRG